MFDNKQQTSSALYLNSNKASTRNMLAQQQEYRHHVGDTGERYVLEMERLKLKDTMYANLVKDVSDDFSIKYDIISYTLDGEELFIEVKSTENASLDRAFIMSSNELHFAWSCYQRGKPYELHRVYDLKGEPKRLIITADVLFGGKVELAPKDYYVRLEGFAQMQRHSSSNVAKSA